MGGIIISFPTRSVRVYDNYLRETIVQPANSCAHLKLKNDFYSRRSRDAFRPLASREVLTTLGTTDRSKSMNTFHVVRSLSKFSR